MKDIIKFIDYDRISDVIMHLNGYTVVKIAVSLNRKDKLGRRNNFYSEYAYGSNKYTDASSLVSIRRTLDPFISIEHTMDDVKESVMIRPSDMIYIRKSLELTMDWFFGENYKDLFRIKKNGTLGLSKRVEPIFIRNLAMSKFLAFEPIPMTRFDDTDEPGVRIWMSSDKIYTDVLMNNFMGFVYFMMECNMYLSAQVMLSALGMPPERERNRSNMGDFRPTVSPRGKVRKLTTVDDD
jgi:hypothetical protein